jgi:hypothetical protein
VKFPLSGVVHSAANDIAGFISRIPICITVLPTRVRAESSGRRDVLNWPAQKPHSTLVSRALLIADVGQEFVGRTPPDAMTAELGSPLYGRS